MHSAGYRSIAVLLIAATTITLGCRGPRPFGRYVEVTKGSDTDLADIPAPDQRLATAKPRGTGDLSTPSTSESAEESPHVTRTASQKTRTPATKSLETRQANLQREDQADSGKSNAETSQSAAERLASNKDIASKSESVDALAEVDPAELMEAFSDYPPEVQREALRRLVAVTSRSADRTTQPNDMQAQLTKSMQDLPELPAAKNKVPDVPPKRIAANNSVEETTAAGKSAAVASISDVPSSGESVIGGAADSDDLVVADRKSPDSKSETKNDASEVVAVSVNQDGAVQHASVSRDHAEPSMIVRASAEGDTSPATDSNGPQVDSSSATLELSQDDLFAQLLTQLATSPAGETEAEKSGRLIRLRHLMVLSGDPDAAVEKIEGMSDDEQEFLRHQLLGLWTMIDPEGHPVPSRRFTTAVPQIREAAKYAAAATDSLEVRSLAFCTEIESYGQINAFPGNRFDSGQQVILYCEIENFSVKQIDDGFETHLQGSFDIYNADNEKVVSQLLPADQQVSANYLRDYFIAYQMYLPSQLSAGTYRMQLTMEDVNGKKYGQASIPFEIAK